MSKNTLMLIVVALLVLGYLYWRKNGVPDLTGVRTVGQSTNG